MGRGGKLDGVVLGEGGRVTAKEYLRQLKTLDNMINAKLLERERIRALSEKVTVPQSEKVQCSSGGGFENVVIKIQELEDEINADVYKLVDLKREARGLIGKLEDERHKIVLIMYYVSDMTFEKVAEQTNYSFAAVHSLHKAALRGFEKIYREKSDKSI